MLEVDDKLRLSAQEALQHPWFKIVNSQKNTTQVVSCDVFSQMSKFQPSSTLRKAAICLLIKMTEDKEIQNLRDQFEMIDEDNSGMIDEDEVREAVRKAGFKMSNKQLNLLFENLDNNENRKIDYTEFIMSTIDLDKFLTDDKINAIFNCFDIDHSGSLNF